MNSKIQSRILAVSLLIAMAGCVPSPSGLEVPAVELPESFIGRVSYIDAQTVREWRSDGAPLVLLDVRTLQEFKEDGHAPGAVLHSYHLGEKRLANSRFLAEVSAAVLPDQRIVVLCASGTRATHAAWELSQRNGFSNIHVLAGGYNGADKKGYASGAGWNAAGLPLLFTPE